MTTSSQRVARIDAVVISPVDAGYLADALDLFETLAMRIGSKPTPRLQALRASLAAAAGVSRSDGGVSDSGAMGFDGSHSRRAYLDTTEAARILGCSTGNVRDLARRGILSAIRAGGRWLLDAAAVHARAAGW